MSRERIEPSADDLRRARAAWTHVGRRRPPFADEPGPGQESVWDYPRPPRLAPDDRRVIVRSGPTVLADTRRALRVLETASPPTVYLPREDVDVTRLVRGTGSSVCEWKGRATYWDVVLPARTVPRAAWSYEDPDAAFAPLDGHLAFYPALLECSVDGERVRPQPGGFYGGWVTDEIVGPFKGEPGTAGW